MFTFKHFFLLNFHCLTYSAMLRNLCWGDLEASSSDPVGKPGKVATDQKLDFETDRMCKCVNAGEGHGDNL